MSIDQNTMNHIAKLARIAVSEEESKEIEHDFNIILKFIDSLNEVDITDVEPMVSVLDTKVKQRTDQFSENNKLSDILANSPTSDENYFMVPKIME